MVASFFEVLTTAFTTYVPALGSGIYDLFVALFCEVATEGGAVTGLNALGEIAVSFVGIGIIAGLVATVMGILRLRKRSKRRKAKRA